GVVLVRGLKSSGDVLALTFALGVGACIAGYTLVDDHGIEHAAPLPYFELVLLICALPYAAGVAYFKGRHALRNAADRRSLPGGARGGGWSAPWGWGWRGGGGPRPRGPPRCASPAC